MDKKKGFTLIELIITMGIGLMVMMIAYNILFVGIKGHSKTLNSFEEQSDIRYAIETTNNAIRFSTVGFTITGDDFKPNIENGDVKGLVKPWSYIGLGSDNKSIVHYKYVPIDDKTGSYKMDVLAKGLDNLTYDLKFTKPKESQESKIIRYILKVNSNGKSETIATEVEAINALHIIDWGDAKNPSVALAYRTEETPEIHKKPVAAISMVLDTSGSMNWGMNGEGTTIKISNPVRLNLLKNTLTDPTEGLFSIFKESDVFVSLVPFSTNANIPHKNYNNRFTKEVASKFYNVKNEETTLENMVKELVADGGTNTGDGLRRAYYQLEKFNDAKNSVYNLSNNQKVKNYIIVLVDGVTTFGSANIYVSQITYGGVWYGKNPSFIIDSGENIGDAFYTTNNNLTGNPNKLVEGDYRVDSHPIPRPIGDGANLDSKYGEEYVKKIGQMIQNSKIVDQAFVIGYSNATKIDNGKIVYHELESLTNIARSLGITVEDNEAREKFKDNNFVFVATDKESLKEAFNNIGGYISEELWQIEGPKLKP